MLSPGLARDSARSSEAASCTVIVGAGHGTSPAGAPAPRAGPLVLTPGIGLGDVVRCFAAPVVLAGPPHWESATIRASRATTSAATDRQIAVPRRGSAARRPRRTPGPVAGRVP